MFAVCFFGSLVYQIMNKRTPQKTEAVDRIERLRKQENDKMFLSAARGPSKERPLKNTREKTKVACNKYIKTKKPR